MDTLTLFDIERRVSPILMDSHHVVFGLGRRRSNGYSVSRMAAVLIIIHSKNSIPYILLTRRSSNLKYHTKEISFPGGQYSADDSSLLDTALRETSEEIGLCFESQNILGRLQTVHTLTSNFVIVPFMTLQENIPEPKISANEVNRIVDIPLQEILATFEPDIEHYHVSQEGVYKFTYQKFVIWGATARILKQLKDCIDTKNE